MMAATQVDEQPTIVIANGDALRLPPGRTNIDWECELGLVIGRTADHVPAPRARSHIVGYTLETCQSDRAGPRRHHSWRIGGWEDDLQVAPAQSQRLSATDR
jgi:2-keto-4-pentenoate hydratase/2-oxohepta-3-ene-1,7-dioic acid hydratase in catechol pathway